MDTLREVTTITIQTNEMGDTIKVTTVTDRTKVRTRDSGLLRMEYEKILVDTVYIDKEENKSVAVVSSNTEIDEQGNITKRVNKVAQTLKWVFAIIIALMGLIIIERQTKRKT